MTAARIAAVFTGHRLNGSRNNAHLYYALDKNMSYFMIHVVLWAIA